MKPGQYRITKVAMPFGPLDTVILFSAVGRRANGRFCSVAIAVDRRPASDIYDALQRGEKPLVEPESWQVLG